MMNPAPPIAHNSRISTKKEKLKANPYPKPANDMRKEEMKKTFRRPIMSDRRPKINAPMSRPRKKADCESLGRFDLAQTRSH
jgi:hypothetical protein